MTETVDSTLRNSHRLLQRAERVIPGASQTLSKGPSQWVQGVAPNYLERGEGAWVWDVDGNRYLDFPMGLGPVILGYGHPAVDEAIRRQLRNGITFSLPHRLEVEVAERISEIVPGAERVRFMKTGSDVCAAAVRLARIHTGRDHVISADYHGWHDWYMGQSAWPNGIPKAVRDCTRQVAAFEDVARYISERVACVIIEPNDPAEALQEVVDLAREYGALAIFDEVITGFRLAPGGAQEHFGVTADLAVFGKALGNGMPISAITGREEIMRDVMFLSITHGGETLSLAAAQATLDVMMNEPVHDHLWTQGRRLANGICNAIKRHDLGEWVRISGLAPRTIVQVREPADGLLAKSLLQQEMLKQGVLFNGNNFISYAHTAEDIDLAVEAYDHAFEVLASALPGDVNARLEGPPVSPVFRSP